MLSNIVLGFSKLFIGIFGRSPVLLADAVHGLGDLAIDLVTLWAHTLSKKGWSEKYPFGYGKYEVIGSFAVSTVLVISGIGLIYNSYENLNNPASEYGGLAISIAAFSIIVKEILYRVTKFVAIKENSDLLLANAWHHRTDAITSFITIIGLGGSMLGIPYTDPAAGIALSLLILSVGFKILVKSFRELVDEQDMNTKIHLEEYLKSLNNKEMIYHIRARKFGAYSIVDLYLKLERNNETIDLAEKLKKRYIPKIS